MAKAEILRSIQEWNDQYREKYPQLVRPEPEWIGTDDHGWHWDSGETVFTIVPIEVLS